MQDAWIDATGIAEMIRAGDISPGEVLDAAIVRAEASHASLNFLTGEMYDRAKARAKLPVGDGVFAGVPYLLKDMSAVAGEVTGFGSNCTLAAPPAVANSEAVDSIEQAGFNIFGLTAMSEFGYIPATESVRHGPTLNPWDLSRSPGGSSGGAGAAVAAGVIPMADAADGGGSIRIPASNCGLFGLKPSRKRLRGEFPTTTGIDLVVQNPVSVTVRDTANYMVATERSASDALYPPLEKVEGPSTRRLKVGWHLNSLRGHRPQREVAAAVISTALLLEQLGHHVEETEWPFDPISLMAAFGALWVKGAHDVNASIAELVPGGDLSSILEPYTVTMGQLGPQVGPEQLAEATATAELCSKQYFDWFDRFDVIISPVLLTPPVEIGHLDPRVPFEQLSTRIEHYCDYTMVQNLTGGPAMSVPLGMTAKGLPIGVQFAADLGDDASLLALAFELEQAQPWRDRHPAHWAFA